MLILNLVGVINQLQSYAKGAGDATDLFSSYSRPTGIPAHPIAELEPLRTVRRPVCVARNDSGRSPGRDRAG